MIPPRYLLKLKDSNRNLNEPRNPWNGLAMEAYSPEAIAGEGKAMPSSDE